MFVHMFRTYFTGAFRKPREANWVIGVVLILIGTFEGFSGYSLPDDLLSGTGLRIASGITLSVPVVGTWVHWMLFGGEFPGTEIIPRLYIIHVLILPGLLLALIAVHVGLVWYQKHTQFPGPGRTETTSSASGSCRSSRPRAGRSSRSRPASSGMMAGIFQINPIWNMGPYDAAHISAGSQPDFYMMWSDGMARIFPPWEFYLFGEYTIPSVFLPTAAFLPVLFVIAGAYPCLERRFTGDRALHNLLQRPRDVPVRTSLGAMGVAFYMVLVIVELQRLDRLLLPLLAQRHHLGRADRAAGGAAARLLPDLPVVHRAAAIRPRRAPARRRDRDRPPAPARRVRRGAPAAGRVDAHGHPSSSSTRAHRCRRSSTSSVTPGTPRPARSCDPTAQDETAQLEQAHRDGGREEDAERGRTGGSSPAAPTRDDLPTRSRDERDERAGADRCPAR